MPHFYCHIFIVLHDTIDNHQFNFRPLGPHQIGNCHLKSKNQRLIYSKDCVYASLHDHMIIKMAQTNQNETPHGR